MLVSTRDGNYWRIVTLTATLILLSSLISTVPAFAQGRTSTASRLEGLRVVAARRVTVEGKSAIEVNFDAESAKRLLQFSVGAVGQRAALLVNGRKLATLRLLDPLTEGHILLSGELDREAAETLFVPRASVDLVIE
jgi:hypothetical protein